MTDVASDNFQTNFLEADVNLASQEILRLLCLLISSEPFPPVFRRKFCKHFSFPCVLHVPKISSSLIWTSYNNSWGRAQITEFLIM